MFVWVQVPLWVLLLTFKLTTMITEDYVSFECAKLLKEKGFDESCECFYDTEHNDISIVNGWINISNSELEEKEILCYSAPTHQMAMKWLREVHNIIIVVEPYMFDYVENKSSQYKYSMWCGDNYEDIEDIEPTSICTTYEECCEAALKYSLENLI